MAKYSYTDENSITFNNLDSNPSPKLTIPGKIVNAQNDFEYANEDGIKPVVNAVEIDWNNANIADAITELNNTDGQITEGTPVETINTTGDLLYTIANLQAQVTVLTNLVKGLYMALATPSTNS